MLHPVYFFLGLLLSNLYNNCILFWIVVVKYLYLFFCSRLSIGSTSSGDTDIQYIQYKASELFPKKSPWIEGDLNSVTTPPFPQLPGEFITYEVCLLFLGIV